MFGPVEPTRYDLVFSLFGIPVRIIPWFWLTGVLLGFDLLHDQNNGPLLLSMWLVVVFVSILVHELGHATLATLFGYRPNIVLYHFGGLAMFEPLSGYSTARAILISFAGPGFGFILGGIIYALSRIIPPENLSYVGEVAIDQMLWVNITWGLVNLLPVLPLDGGQIARDVCLASFSHRGMSIALRISIIVAGSVGTWFVVDGQRYNGIFFVALAVQNYRNLKHHQEW